VLRCRDRKDTNDLCQGSPAARRGGWETARPGEDRLLLPGVITHASNIVEHPELIAERITRYAWLVGRGNVIASTDCGFSSQATYRPEVDPRVMWAKFGALREGAALASARLWP
jgi:5-methyltetrahydropteroyltriglutamate--homocysteine methyltransferase